MLDIKFIRDNKEIIIQNCLNRHVKLDIDELLRADEDRRKLLSQIEELRATRNKKSKTKPTPEEIETLKKTGVEISNLENALLAVQAVYDDLMMQVPNLTHPETPIGDEDGYRVVFESKNIPQFNFTPKDHDELFKNHDLIDFERGTKVTEAKFYFLKNNLVRLNMAMLNYGIDIATSHGYTLVEAPDLANNDILKGAGFNPRGPETQIYSIENTNLSLIGTAEIPMGGYFSGEVLDLTDGPKKFVAVSHCYRTEAGSYGRTSKGLYRVHQFTKLEMFIFCKPEDSEALHQEILAIEREIADGLEIPYRVIDIASSDLGGPAYRKYDLEAWMTMKSEGDKLGGWGEITSTSNCTDFQARRLNIKHRKADGTMEYVHTLNGTAVVLSRFPIAVAESHQQADGSIVVPKVLKKYCNLDTI